MNFELAMKQWEFLKKQISIRRRLTNEDIINILLENRNLKTKKAIDSFLNPQLENLSLDYVGLDKIAIEKAVNRIKTALENQEQIIIYGDYDVDGITASAILWEILFFELKAKVAPYIPNRVNEGYGISKLGIDNLKLKYPDTKLIITVDNGIVANDAVEYADKIGIDVIITDHHVAGEKLPRAHSIVHTTKLCGAGIAYLLKKELVRYFKLYQNPNSKNKSSGRKFDNYEDDDHLELAALGTIADLVPLTDANRMIVKFGLNKLSQTKRPGLLALYQEAGIDTQKIGVYEVGHIIAPRLNATGRMKSAMDSLRLLCTKDGKRARDLASLLGVTNKERQSVMIDATKHASLSVNAKTKLKKLLIVSYEEYPEGVIGLVAGRLVEEFYRPSIVISKGKKLSKGSVRSIKGFNIIEFLRQSHEYFINIGGHPMAAGFTIETDKLEQMQEALEKLSDAFDDSIYVRKLRIDCDIPFSVITKELYDKIQTLNPFGMNNPEPVFATFGALIHEIRKIGRDGKHLKMILNKDNFSFEAIAFGMSEQASELSTGDIIDIAFSIDENRWNGNIKLQLKIKDIKKSEAIEKEDKEL